MELFYFLFYDFLVTFGQNVIWIASELSRKIGRILILLEGGWFIIEQANVDFILSSEHFELVKCFFYHLWDRVSGKVFRGSCEHGQGGLNDEVLKGLKVQ